MTPERLAELAKDPYGILEIMEYCLKLSLAATRDAAENGAMPAESQADIGALALWVSAGGRIDVSAIAVGLAIAFYLGKKSAQDGGLSSLLKDVKIDL